jgi:sulfur-carrier protein adenylyltransferase/sulfurtransferase
VLEPQERKRYSRQILLPEIGMSGQEKLRSARVLVVGAGGLGCPVLQYLTAAGAGYIGIIDNDEVDATNLHRQILYNFSDIGKKKALVSGERLSAQNPHVKITPYVAWLSAENATEIIASYDLIIDGSDNFPTRYLVNDAAVQQNKPVVFGSILRFEGQVSVFNYQNGPTYRCLFPDAEEGDNCEEAGVLGILPGMIGMYMANEAVKIITGAGEVLSGKLLLINALTNQSDIFQFQRTAPQTDSVRTAAPKPPENELTEMSWEEFEALTQSNPEQVELVDVREYIEFEADNFGGTNIPLSDIPESLADFRKDQTIVFYCQTGKRSQKAAKILSESHFEGKIHWAANW